MEQVKLTFVVLSIFFYLTQAARVQEDIPDEKWSYVNVRENAHMFWWLYGAQTSPSERASLPLILWLQGGPGGSSTGFGNFGELGPLDVNLRPRNTTWTQVANVLFVDNPVGAGFSYVTNNNAYTKDVTEIAEDLLTMLQSFMKEMPVFQNIPFFIFCESYGGKMTAAFGVRLYKAISSGEIRCNFKAVALGDSWISPVDSVLTWGPYLYSVSLLDENSLAKVNAVAQSTAKAVEMGQYKNATKLWGDTEAAITEYTDNVDVYNILIHNAPPFPKSNLLGETQLGRLYSTHVGRLYTDPLTAL
ncbi:retinoid-inducible serine carboxypeptidase, partial [Exaiptasia diaphana]|uniref:Retinoid-inducible serine carboxypeptidase n=1 Tax=Exaiptasia diaphana TaxID=2652724 RepID=A0A913Y0A2_EXADI